MNPYIEAVLHPRTGLFKVLTHLPRLIRDDRRFLKLYYWTKFGRFPDLDSPKSFNEKLNWMKLNLHNPLCHTLADKYAVKEYVADKIGQEYVVPCLGVWDSPEDIDFGSLPDRFVLKCTHDSGGVTLCRDKSSLDRKKVCAGIAARLKKDYYYPGREWVYKGIRPRVIADSFLDDGTGSVLTDYKFWCFGGKPEYMYITVKDKFIFENFYDMDFNPVAVDHGFPRFSPEFGKPACFELMKSLAATLSKPFPFVRVDFFVVGGQVYFGEFTFYDWGGLQPFGDFGTDLRLGEMIEL